MLAPIPQITGSVPQGAGPTFMSTPEFDTLSTAAYHTERVLARRLSVKLGLTPAAALAEVLTQAAGAQGLAALLEQRARASARCGAARGEGSGKIGSAGVEAGAHTGAGRRMAGVVRRLGASESGTAGHRRAVVRTGRRAC